MSFGMFSQVFINQWILLYFLTAVHMKVALYTAASDVANGTFLFKSLLNVLLLMYRVNAPKFGIYWNK